MSRRVVAAIAALAALVPASAGCAMHSREPLSIAIPFDEPGYGVQRALEHEGFDVDLGIALSTAAGYPDERSDYILMQGTEGNRGTLWRGGADLMVLTRPITDDVRDRAFSLGPFLTGRQTYATRTADATRLRTPAAVRRVCTVAGTLTAARAETDFPKAERTTQVTASTCLTDLLAGTVDAVADESPNLTGYAGTPPFKGAIAVSPVTLRPSQYYVAVAKDRPELCRTISDALRTVISSGTWADLYRKDVVEPGYATSVPTPPPLTATTCQ